MPSPFVAHSVSRPAGAAPSRRCSFASSFRFFVVVLSLLAPLPAFSAAYTYISLPGCPSGRASAWPERSLPTQWHFHEAGYSGLPDDELESALIYSFDQWAEPCCSNFRHEYRGRSHVRPTSSLPHNVVAFEESSWPRTLGRFTIAVTFFFGERCELSAADILYNASTFSFTLDPEDTAKIDLIDVAIHEFGHWLGLSHSSSTESIMYPAYQREHVRHRLLEHDRAGVCSIYPRPCEDCVRDGDCPAGYRCTDGDCEPIPCEVLSDCPFGTVCGDGRCVPGCRRHLDCSKGERCYEGVCMKRADRCTVCQTCTSATECGSTLDGAACVVVEGRGRCTFACEEDDDCPAGSSCWDLPGYGTGLCLGENAPTCPAGFTCQVDPPCPGLWEACSPGEGRCSPALDACVDFDGERSCTCTCRENADCGPDAFCALDPQSRERVCWPYSLLERCGSRYCGLGERCVDGACVEPCEELLCEAGEICVHGSCLSVCGSCPEGTTCDATTLRCAEEDPCATRTCPEGRSCRAGLCVDLCANVNCGEGEVCSEGSCVAAPRPAQAKSDKDGGGCSTAPGPSLWVALAAGLWLHWRRMPRKGEEATE